jgi:hypothetical protein
MDGPLTLDDVLKAGLPAFGGELYRYSPTKGFFRASTARFAPDWLPVPWPAHGDEVLWRHEGACSCSFCSPPATPLVTTAAEPGKTARDLARTA